jgi:putative membrane protein
MDGLSSAWPWNPGVLLFLLAFCLLYVLGLRSALRRTSQDAPVKAYHIACFFAAVVIMAPVLLTPIDTIARTQLFSIHMAQVVVLTTICAPLVLAGSPARLLRPFVTLPLIRRLTHPLVASLTFNLLFLLWHAPRFFNAACSTGGRCSARCARYVA